MSDAADLARGRPVFVLAIILAAWIGGRVVMYEPQQQPFPVTLVPTLAAPLSAATPSSARVSAKKPASAAPVATIGLQAPAIQPSPWMPPPSSAGSANAVLQPYSGGGAVRRSASSSVQHAMLLSTGRSGGSRLLAASYPANEPPAARPHPSFVPRATDRARAEMASDSRFSADAWGLWRDGSADAVAPGGASYGRSQMGAILRYALSATSPNAPEAYLRASAALDGGRENDIALGLSARPVADIPLRIAVEGRVTDTERRTQLRGGAYVVTELPPVDLPAGTTGEAYLQAGYVTGENGTPFIDGQVRVTGDLAELDDFRLSAGAGAWGGAQEGTQRLDVGPTASVSFPLGEGYARVSADYRVRVTGNAAPDSGPALTVATGF